MAENAVGRIPLLGCFDRTEDGQVSVANRAILGVVGQTSG